MTRLLEAVVLFNCPVIRPWGLPLQAVLLGHSIFLQGNGKRVSSEEDHCFGLESPGKSWGQRTSQQWQDQDFTREWMWLSWDLAGILLALRREEMSGTERGRTWSWWDSIQDNQKGQGNSTVGSGRPTLKEQWCLGCLLTWFTPLLGSFGESRLHLHDLGHENLL